MVVFTKLDRLVHEEMKKEDAEYDENRSRTMKDQGVCDERDFVA